MSTVPVPDELVAQLEHRLHFAGPETGFPRAGSRIEETSVADGVKTLVLERDHILTEIRRLADANGAVRDAGRFPTRAEMKMRRKTVV
jgi:hypothetical protein